MNYLPRLLLNSSRFTKNLLMMKKKTEELGIEFRPHFKTHQSIALGSKFREHGITGITVSSVDMAAYFVADGWKDITIAFPSPIHKIDLVNELLPVANLKLLVSSKESINKLEKQLKSEVQVYVELNSGQNRSGISIQDLSEIDEIVTTINNSTKLKFYGFYCHAGQTYSSASVNEIREKATPVIQELTQLLSTYPEENICYGDTPSCSVLDDFGPITQLSPGNFIFYDWMQVNIGSCKAYDVAVAMECPIVEKNDSRKQLIIHGGAIHFSKDSIIKDGVKVFGQISDKAFNVLDGNFIVALSQEHGVVQCTPSFYNSVEIGDSILVLPIHSCLTANLMAEYVDSESGERYDHKQKRPA